MTSLYSLPAKVSSLILSIPSPAESSIPEGLHVLISTACKFTWKLYSVKKALQKQIVDKEIVLEVIWSRG